LLFAARQQQFTIYAARDSKEGLIPCCIVFMNILSLEVHRFRVDCVFFQRHWRLRWPQVHKQCQLHWWHYDVFVPVQTEILWSVLRK